MSLLMDALKKAELAKRQGGDSGAAMAAASEDVKEISLEPLSIRPITEPGHAATGKPPASSIPDALESAAPPSPLPDLSAHLEKLDADFLAAARQQAMRSANRTSPASREAPAPVPPRQVAKDSAVKLSPPNTPQDQAAAQNVFTAKRTTPAPRKNFALAVGSATLLASIAIGGYFWWQLQPKSALTANPVASDTSAPPQTPGLSAPLAATPAAPSAAQQAPPAYAIQPGHANSTDDDEESEKNIAAMKTRPQQDAERSRPDTRDEPIHLTRTPLRVDPDLMQAFDAFNRGDLAIARVEYERVLKSDSRNTDALHGLAAVALRQGQPDQAEWLYQQALEVNPQDPTAQSALINIRGRVDPVAAESRLKTLAAEQPELAAPHFALGNLYARQGRWGEAQPAYFRAWNAEPDNPDILYNLAISLEHLHQTRLAAQYYSLAIAAANTRPAGFDKMQAEARLHALQP